MIRRGLVVVGLVAGLVLATTACSSTSPGGGQPFADDGDGTASERDATIAADEQQTAGTLDLAAPTSYLVEATLEVNGFSLLSSGTVIDAEHYDLVLETDGLVQHAVRDGDAVYRAQSSELQLLDGRPFIEQDVTSGTALGRLAALDEPLAGLSGADVAVEALFELLVTDPATALDLQALAAAGGGPEPVDAPEAVVTSLDALGLGQPDLLAEIEVTDGELTRAAISVGGGAVDYELAASYHGHGEPQLADLAVPGPEQLDATPWVEEEQLAAFTDTALLAPTSVPGDLVLVSAVVLDPTETAEDCAQVEIDYATPPDLPPGDDTLRFFLVPTACANAADPTPFDQSFGGFPSRSDGYEVLIGSTVVQVVPSLSLPLDDVEASVATLAPVTADQLIAAVVPPD